jgi:general secretion pathway protein B
MRGHGSVAARISIQPVMLEEMAPPHRWPYALAGIALAGASLSLLWPHRAPPTADAAAEVPRKAQPALPRVSAPPQASAPPSTAAAPPQERTLTPTPPAAGAPAAKHADDAKAAHGAAATEAARPSAAAPGSGKPTMTVAELPAALQRALPPLSVAGFVQVEGAGGMAMVNDKLVREGEEVAPGLILEKVLADSVIFSYDGVRFKR